MTLPDERYRALVYAREFLYQLLDPKATPKVPKSVRQHAGMVLRHFPGVWELNIIAEDCKEGSGIIEAPKRESKR